MDSATRQLVRRRAGDRCEYCLLVQEHSIVPHQIEHIVARQHGGSDDPNNHALACSRCNAFKGPNLAGFDTDSGNIIAIFHPRRDVWETHLKFDGPRIIGLTPAGRVTVSLLAMNEPRRLQLRIEFLSDDSVS